MAYLIAAILMTLSILESHPLLQAFVLLFLNLFLMLHVRLICANTYLLTYLLQGGRSIQSLHDNAWGQGSWRRASTGSKASGPGVKPLKLDDIYQTNTKFEYLQT